MYTLNWMWQTRLMAHCFLDFLDVHFLDFLVSYSLDVHLNGLFLINKQAVKDAALSSKCWTKLLCHPQKVMYYQLLSMALFFFGFLYSMYLHCLLVSCLTIAKILYPLWHKITLFWLSLQYLLVILVPVAKWTRCDYCRIFIIVE